MEKRRLPIAWVSVLAFLAFLNSAAIAQDQSVEPQVNQNLRDMSALLQDISAQLNTGKMTPEAQKAAGKITQHVSQLLEDLAGIGSEIHSKHQSDIKKMKKAWDPFAAEALTND